VEFVALFKEYGAWCLLVAYFVWQTWIREGRMAKRLDTLEDTDRQARDNLVKAMERNTVALRGICDALRTRPCLVDTSTFHHRTPAKPIPTIPQSDSDAHPVVKGKQ
jgi:hypothetical protein